MIKWLRKNYVLCFSLCSFLFAVLFLFNSASALSLTTQKFQLSRTLSNGSLAWSPDKYYNTVSEDYKAIDAYRIYWNPITPNGNTASLHFETNIVFFQPSSALAYYGSFSNLDSFGVNSCNFPIANNSVSTALTYWDSNGVKNITLTIYGDLSLTGLTSGTSTQIICIVGTSGNFFTNNTTSNFMSIYFEQNPTSILFSNNMDSSLLQTQIQQNSTIIQQNINTYDMVNDRFDLMSQQNINTYNMQESKFNQLNQSIQDSEDGEQSRWELDKQEQQDKEDELESSSGDLSINASNTGNPFASLFNASGCQNMPTVGGWFGDSSLRICSPYPSSIGGVIRFVGSAVVVALLIRLYYKKLKGGVDG